MTAFFGEHLQKDLDLLEVMERLDAIFTQKGYAASTRLLLNSTDPLYATSIPFQAITAPTCPF